MSDLIGHTINNFEVQEVIGQGGMGIVYRAYHPDLQSFSAVKIMRPEYANQPGFYERFLQEARTAARLTHPGIVDVINFGRYQDSYYLMMDYVEGPSLRALIQDHPGGLPLWDVVQIFIQIAEVLEFSHAAGVLHRDLKPDNILLTKSVRIDQPYRAIVTDFGLVKLAANSIFETQEGISVGTPAYMSPEQCRGSDIDGRADLYSFGVMLYECVCGSRPHPIRSLFDAAKFHSSGRLVPLRAHRLETPNSLDALVKRLLATDLSRRSTNATEVVAELKKIITVLEAGVEEAASGAMSGIYEKLIVDIEGKSQSLRQKKGKEAAEAEVAKPSPIIITAVEPPKGAKFFVNVCYQGQWDNKRYDIAPGKVLIVGRQTSADIVLDRPERFVSKQHCEILLRDDRVLIRDLGSTNGTFIGENRLTSDTFYEWAVGADVLMGPFMLALRREDPPPPPPPPPQPPPAEDQTQKEDKPESMVTTKVKMPLLTMLVCRDANPDRLPIGEKPIVLGRASDCDMVIVHQHVSKRHCAIQRGPDGITITDLKSTNGTHMNGQRLVAEVATAWSNEVVVQIGPFTLSLETAKPA